MQTLAELMHILPQQGRLAWIGIRPARGEPMLERESAELVADRGLDGDRFATRAGRSGGRRQVTLIQAEHVQAVASVMQLQQLHPRDLRRNLMVSGLNLLALKGRQFLVGETVFEYTTLCHPCSKMERLLGPGGYNAMRGHGGICARVLEGGTINVGDRITAI